MNKYLVNTIPQDWIKKNIGDLCEILDSKRVPLSDEQRQFIKGDIPYYGANGLVDKINKYIFDEDLLLVAEDGGNFDEWQSKPIAYRVQGKSWVNNHAHVLRNKKEYSLDFIFYNLEFRNITFYVSGGTRGKLNQGQLRIIPLIIPKSKKEQEKIASILSTIDLSIEKTEQLINKYKSIKQGLMQDLFRYGIDEKGQIRSEKTHKFKDSPLGRIPEEWGVTNFESVCIPSGMVRGPFGGALKKEIFVKEGFKVYEQSNAIYKTTTLGDYFVTAKKYKEMSRFSIKPGDFILSCSGTVGCLYRIPRDAQEGIINQALLKITLSNKLVPELFEYYFEAEFRNRIIDSTQGGVINNLVGMSQIRNALFKYIPLPEQEKIATTLTSISNSIDNEEIYSSKLQSIKQGLMQDLLTGKVRVNHLLN